MTITESIRGAGSDPLQLENLYKTARRAGQDVEFGQAMQVLHAEEPDNLLFAAWIYRLAPDEAPVEKPAGRSNWLIAAPISIVTGLIFWLLSGLETELVEPFPFLLLVWSPIATAGALVYLAVAGKRTYRRPLLIFAGLIAAALYTVLVAPGLQPEWLHNDYLTLALIHIPLLCWAGLGLSEFGFNSSKEDRIAFLIKSVEVMVTAGVYLVVGVIFGGITQGMFLALGIYLPDIWLRLIMAGGVGLLPVLAVATIYDPSKAPFGQDFSQGLSRFVATMMRLLQPLTLTVLVVYIIVIPFNFFEPFKNRDVLIVFNAMLFGIMGLLLGATPVRGTELSAQLQTWLRRGVISIAVLAALVSMYALSAIIFRTVEGGWTINRLTVTGWNSINIGILLALVYNVIRAGSHGWIAAQHRVFAMATNAYILWGLFLLILVPILFR